MSWNLPMPLLRLALEGKSLTPREKLVLRRLALGDTQVEAAVKLGVSLETVRKQSKSARARLGARTNAQAVAIAVSLDLI